LNIERWQFSEKLFNVQYSIVISDERWSFELNVEVLTLPRSQRERV